MRSLPPDTLAGEDDFGPAEPGRRLKWVVGLSLLALGVGGLALWTLTTPGAVSYYATASELRAEAEADPARVWRLGGRVETLDRTGATVVFTVTDGTSSVPVRYRGEVPDTLKAQTDVIAEGTLDGGGTLVATRVLAKCSSKFVPVDQADEHLGRTTAAQRTDVRE